MSAPLELIRYKEILTQLKPVIDLCTVTLDNGKVYLVRGVIADKLYVSTPGSDEVMMVPRERIPHDQYAAQGINGKKLTKGFLKQPSTLVHVDGTFYQCVTETKVYRPLTDKVNVVG